MTTGTSGHDAAQGGGKHLKQVRPAQVEQQRRLCGRWIRVTSVGAAVAVIAVAGGWMLTSRQGSSAATLVGAAAAPAVVGSGSTPSPTMAADMPGMDMSGSSPSPTMAADMPGDGHVRELAVAHQY